MTELVFHLGDRKTGSTAIQSVLAAGAWRCGGRRLLYPGGGFNHVPLARSLWRQGTPQARARHFRALAAAIAAERPDVAVVSAEAFESADPAALRAALEEFLPGLAADARLVAYVRPHAGRLVSAWAEQTKQGMFFGPMAALHGRMLRHDRLLYAPRFRAWRAAFGDRFTLRPFIRDRLAGGDVVRDFLGLVFGHADFTFDPAPEANESLALGDLAVMRMLQYRLRPDRDRAAAGERLPHHPPGGPTELQSAAGWAFARLLAAAPPARPPGHPGRLRRALARRFPALVPPPPDPAAERPRLHRALAQEVLETYREDAAELDAEFFADLGGPMTAALEAAPGRAPEAPQPWRAAELFAPAELRRLRAWADFTAGLLLAREAGWPAHFRGEHREAMRGGGDAGGEDAGGED